MTRTVSETIYEGDYLSYDYLQELVSNVPEEFRKSIILEAENKYYPYASEPTINIEVSYSRPESPEETVIRIETEDKRKIDYEAKELREFKRLQEKFGVSTK